MPPGRRVMPLAVIAIADSPKVMKRVAQSAISQIQTRE
jgi:hypothetical protein